MNSPDHVVRLLQNSVHKEESVRIPAQRELELTQSQPGYVVAIANIVLERSKYPSDFRFLASICLKNSTDKYWKQHKPDQFVIPDEEKNTTKNLIAELLREPERLIAEQIIIFIQRVAKLDWPSQWPDLIPKLIHLTRDGDHIQKVRSIHAFRKVIAGLASKRIAQHKKEFSVLSQNILPFISSLWNSYSNGALQIISTINVSAYEDNTVCQAREVCLITMDCLYMLKHIILYGFNNASDFGEVIKFIQELLPSITNFGECYNNIRDIDVLKDAMEKLLLRSAKIILRSLKSQFFRNYLGDAIPRFLMFMQRDLFPEFTISCLLILKDFISDDFKDDQYVDQLKIMYFSPENLKAMVYLLMSKFIVYTEFDLEEWKENPEEWHHEDQCLDCSLSQRGAAEALFLSALASYTDSVVATVKEMLSKIESEPVNSLQAIISRDAVYNVIGIGYDSMFDDLKADMFEVWLKNTLIPLSRLQIYGGHILRRRIIWLVGKWVSRLTKTTRVEAYKMLEFGLKDEETTVRLASAESVEAIIGDCGFDLDPFLPFFTPFLSSLLQLAITSSSSASKTKAFNAIAIIIELTETLIKPYAHNVLASLQDSWINAADSFLRSGILRTVITLVKASQDSSDFYNFIVPVIIYCTDLENPDALYLLEDGLELLHSCLENATSASQQLYSTFPSVYQVILNTNENIDKCLAIIESFVFLGQSEFMALFGRDIIYMFDQKIGNLKDSSTIKCFKLFQLLLQCFPHEFLVIAESPLTKLIHLILSNEQSKRVQVFALGIIARILVATPQFGEKVLLRGNMIHPEWGMSKFCNLVFELANSTGDIYLRKLLGLSLCSVLLMDAACLNFLSEMVNYWVNIALDHESSERSYENGNGSISGESAQLSPVKKIRLEIQWNDPAITSNMKVCAVNALNSAKEKYQQAFLAVVEKIDPLILNQLFSM